MAEVYYRAYMEPTCEFLGFPFNEGDYKLCFMEIKVLSHTPCGVWLAYPTGRKDKKFVNNNNKKRFAYPTTEEAREALGFRLRSYHSHLTAKLEGVEAELRSYDAIVRRTKL